MNREAFEKLCNSLEWDITHTIKSSRIRDLMWVTWCNATEHAQQWIPYNGQTLPDGKYVVTFVGNRFGTTDVSIDSYSAGLFDLETDGCKVTAYHQLPAPYGGE